MNEYENYVKEINNIFSVIEKLKNSWSNNDSLNHIDEINQFKKIVIQGADFLEQESRKKV